MPDPVHSYNHGAVTSMKGPAFEAIKVTGLDSTPGASAVATIGDQVRSSFINKVQHTATGIYTFQLNLPYPPALVACIPALSTASGSADVFNANYQSASYDPVAGTFIINVTDEDTLIDGGSTDELHVWMVFRRYTT